jgi:hypothetical protein
MGLATAQVSIRDYPTGLNVVTLDVDPSAYDPFSVGIRGSSFPVLDGTVIHQYFGLKEADFQINLQGNITSYDTLQALWTKFRQGGGGAEFELRDWFPNRFRVVYTPGRDSFHPVPIPGSCEGHNFTMSVTVLAVLQWFGGAY